MSVAESSYYGADNVVTHDKFGGVGPKGHPLQTGGGGGTYDGMEARVAVLETHVEYIRRDLSDLKADMGGIRTDLSKLRGEVGDLRTGLATLTERVNHLPTKGFIVTATFSTMAVLGAFITFQDHIRAIFSH